MAQMGFDLELGRSGTGGGGHKGTEVRRGARCEKAQRAEGSRGNQEEKIAVRQNKVGDER